MDWTLKKDKRITPRPGPVLIVVMDGVGLGKRDEGDAVGLAHKPVLDWLFDNCPWLPLKAHGTAVGLPSDSDMGNSEVGHNAIGAGRVFAQGAKLVNAAIASGAIFEREVWKKLIRRCQASGALHLIGLLSDANVHSHQDHLHALITRAFEEGVRRVYVHVLLDGRDVPATSALIYVDRLEAHLAKYNGVDGRVYRIASGGGRMLVTMDRYEADWSIVERGWNAHVHGCASRFASAREAIETFRHRELEKHLREHPEILEANVLMLIDQYLPPFVIIADGRPVGPIMDGDSVIFFNFRGDRALEISKAFERDDFPYFDRGRRPAVEFAGMMEYDGDEHVPAQYLVPPPLLDRTMGEYLAHNHVPQFACSETQKFGHVTYFWNGNRSGMFDPRHETYLEIPSFDPPFDERPQMKAPEITDATIEWLRKGKGFGRINYANGDMVGHTGNRDATILAVEAVDVALGRLLEVVREVQGVAVITADHGNSDELFFRDDAGKPIMEPGTGRLQARPSHSLNRVPFILYDPLGRAATGREPRPAPVEISWEHLRGSSPGFVRVDSHGGKRERPLAAWTLAPPVGGAGLANVAATCLNLLGLQAPPDYAYSLLYVVKGI